MTRRWNDIVAIPGDATPHGMPSPGRMAASAAIRLRGPPGAVSPELVAVAATLHRAPAPGAGTGRVDEHQRAVVARALANALAERPGQQLDHLPRQRRQRLRRPHRRHPPRGRAAGDQLGDQRRSGRSLVDGGDRPGGEGPTCGLGMRRRPRSPGAGPWPRSARGPSRGPSWSRPAAARPAIRPGRRARAGFRTPRNGPRRPCGRSPGRRRRRRTRTTLPWGRAASGRLHSLA